MNKYYKFYLPRRPKKPMVIVTASNPVEAAQRLVDMKWQSYVPDIETALKHLVAMAPKKEMLLEIK